MVKIILTFLRSFGFKNFKGFDQNGLKKSPFWPKMTHFWVWGLRGKVLSLFSPSRIFLPKRIY